MAEGQDWKGSQVKLPEEGSLGSFTRCTLATVLAILQSCPPQGQCSSRGRHRALCKAKRAIYPGLGNQSRLPGGRTDEELKS